VATNLDHERQSIDVVDLGEMAHFLLREAGMQREVASINRYRRQAAVKVDEPFGVIAADGPQT